MTDKDANAAIDDFLKVQAACVERGVAVDFATVALILIAYRLDLIDDRLLNTERSVDYISNHLPGDR